MNNRKNTSYVIGTSNVFSLSDEQFKEIENKGRCKLTPKLKQDINDTLTFYGTELSALKNAPDRDTKQKTINEIKNALEIITMFLNSYSDANLLQLRLSVLDELDSLKNSFFKSEGDWRTYKAHFYPEGMTPETLSAKLDNEPFLDADNIADDLSLLLGGLIKYEKQFNAERKNDKGGRTENQPFNSLLFSLNDIYKNSNKKYDQFGSFCVEIFKYLPEDIKPHTNAEAITKQINRYLNAKNS